jgi:hypothetical protein
MLIITNKDNSVILKDCTKEEFLEIKNILIIQKEIQKVEYRKEVKSNECC